MQITANEKMLLTVLLDSPDLIFPPGIAYYDVPPRRLSDFVRLTGLAVGEVSEALDSLVAKSVLFPQHGPGDFITLGIGPQKDDIGGIWYGISDTPEAKAAYDLWYGKKG